jgi:hypothetical protein
MYRHATSFRTSFHPLPGLNCFGLECVKQHLDICMPGVTRIISSENSLKIPENVSLYEQSTRICIFASCLSLTEHMKVRMLMGRWSDFGTVMH